MGSENESTVGNCHKEFGGRDSTKQQVKNCRFRECKVRGVGREMAVGGSAFSRRIGWAGRQAGLRDLGGGISHNSVRVQFCYFFN